MDRKERKNYTEEEIKRYMELLQDAENDPKKIEEVLSYENTGLFQAYLIKIGVNPELVEYAAVVERARKKVKRVLEHCKCKVDDSGIIYENFGESKIYAEEGRLYFDDDEYVTLPDEEGKVRIVSSSNISSYVAIINRFGVLEGEYTSGGPGFSGEYTDIERKMDGSVPICYYESSDGASYDKSKKVADYGNPADCLDQSRTLKENYELFGRLYPRLKQWYEQCFSRYNMEFEEVSDFLVQKQDEIECKEIEQEILLYQRSININNNKSSELRDKLKRMLGFIKNIGTKSLIGKGIADRILTVVNNEPKPEKKAVEDNDKKEESKVLTRREELEKKLEEVKMQSVNSHNEYEYLRRIVNIIESELEKIPLIGRVISKAANKYTPKEDIDFEDKE